MSSSHYFKKIIIVFILAIVPLTISNLNPQSTVLTGVLSPVTAPLQNFFYNISSKVRGTSQLYLNLIDIRKNNRQLTEENRKLKAKITSLAELQLENHRLNKILNFKKSQHINLIAAKVIGLSLISKSQIMTINRGSQHGLKKYMAAIHTGGVVGYVIYVQKNTAKILVLTDPNAVIDTLVQRTRTRGLVEGLSSNKCRFSYFASNDSDIKKNDLLITSGMSNIFPKGLPIGRVSKVKKKQFELKQHIEVTPFVNPQKIEELFVVLSQTEASLASEDL